MATPLSGPQFWARILGASWLLPVALYLVMVPADSGERVGINCGTGQMALLMLCTFATGLLSVLAVALGLYSYFRLPRPRPRRRRIELLLVGNFLVLATGAFVVLCASSLIMKAFGS